jgi:hypothetical protein
MSSVYSSTADCPTPAAGTASRAADAMANRAIPLIPFFGRLMSAAP